MFWKVEGLVSMAAGTSMKGTVIANNAAITMNTGDTLEGRALSTTGAVTVNGIMAYTPIGCGSPILTGPPVPPLGASACYALFSSIGAVSNSGVTFVTGDIGSNNGSATGFNPSDVTGTIHTIPDASTAVCANDLSTAYNDISIIPYDIELLYPAQFGNGLVLTPHTYLLNAATVFTDTLYLNAEGNMNGVFVIRVQGAFTTSVYSKVKLINGAQSKNVFWQIEGAVQLNNYSVFCGTIICHNGALGAINTGVSVDGRLLTTNGALTTTAVTVIAPVIPGGCTTVGISAIDAAKETVTIYPNPFKNSTTVYVNNLPQISNCEFRVYNVLGNEVMDISIITQSTIIETSKLPAGIYFYQLVNDNKLIQSGKLMTIR